MTSEQIDKFLTNNSAPGTIVRIRFKTRSTITGMFIRMGDFEELKEKNFWRIISATNLPEYKKTQDSSLARIFNGHEFTKLELAPVTAAS